MSVIKWLVLLNVSSNDETEHKYALIVCGKCHIKSNSPPVLKFFTHAIRF